MYKSPNKVPFQLLFAMVTLCVMIGSCTYKNKNVLFKTKKELKSDVPVLVVNPSKQDSGVVYMHRIKPGARIQIRFLNNYDIGRNAMESPTSGANMQQNNPVVDKGYLINYDSTVILPLIGRVNLVGLTRVEASKRLEELYSQFIKNPIIEVSITTLRVTVLGEINNPGKIEIDKENTTLFDVIALAGGLANPAKKQKTKIIRGDEIILVDIRNIDVLKDPAIIMHDNDIVYIEPYGVKSQTESLATITNLTSLVLAVSQVTLLTLQIYILTASSK